jgi:hypothetical protein
MAEQKVVLLEQDDLMHPNTGESNYNESAYYNFFDPRLRAGGFVRMGNRANEGYAEMTVCFYLPDGRIGFMFARPEIKNNDAHDAAGLKFEVIKPFDHHRVTYSGKVCMLKNPLEMAEPARAFKSNPYARVTLALNYRATCAGWGGELREKSGAEWVSLKPAGDAAQSFARGHLEQLGHATGTLSIRDDQGELKFDLDALGLRDHSWGPRYWQAPKYYRWLTMNFEPGLGGMATITVNRDGSEHPGGFIARKGEPFERIIRVKVETDFAGEQQLHDRIKLDCETDAGKRYSISGKVIGMIPLRNRRAGTVTRIAEGMTEWTWDGKVGYGLSEYLDQFDE